jgi:chromosomal replication initiation ATPase DnaA
MQLTIRMPDEQMGRIEHIAKKMGLKKSDVTRMAIKKFIEEYSDSTVKPFDNNGTNSGCESVSLLKAVRRGIESEPRDVAMYLIRSMRAEPLIRVGAGFGLKRYSSVTAR